VIDSIANQMGERILDGFENGFVQLCILALHLHLHPLAARKRQIAHHARKSSPDIFDRLHPRLHHAFLQLGRDQAQTLRGVQESGILLRCTELQYLVASQNQFAHEVHQFVQLPHIDANVVA
jgi:hypothetical protein